MRVLGALLFIAGVAATTAAVRASFSRRRPLDVAFGLLAPVALAVAFAGAVLLFVPGFLG